MTGIAALAATSPLIAIGFLSALGVCGDLALKRASMGSGAAGMVWLTAGLTVYALSALGWYFVFRHVRLTTVAGLYGAMTLLLLAGVGIVVFRETPAPQEWLGLGLALLGVLLLSRYA